jgi:hypothetical protein
MKMEIVGLVLATDFVMEAIKHMTVMWEEFADEV